MNLHNGPTKQFSKSYRYFFMLIQILYDLDFGFIEHRTPRYRIIVKILTLTKCLIFFVTVLMQSHNSYMLASGVYSFLNAYSLVTILSFCYKSSFCRLQTDLFYIDSMINNTRSFNIEMKVVLSILLCHLTSAIPGLLCYRYSDECASWSIFKLLTHFVTANIMNTVHIMCFFMFYTVYCRLTVFVESANLYGRQISKGLRVYKAIMDALDRVKRTFDCLYAAGMIFQLPLLLSGTYLYLRKIRSNEFLYDDTILQVVRQLTLLFAPAISAGLISGKAEELALILQDKLLSERNEPHCSDIELFVDYVKARPMKFNVFKIVPMDWTLPILIVDLCITYQIAIVQLTHLF